MPTMGWVRPSDIQSLAPGLGAQVSATLTNSLAFWSHTRRGPPFQLVLELKYLCLGPGSPATATWRATIVGNQVPKTMLMPVMMC